MKKMLFPALLLCGMGLTVVGCKKDVSVNADGKEVVAVDNMDDANAIIEFNNGLIEKSSKNRSNLERVVRYLGSMDAFIAGQTPVLIPPITMPSMSKLAEAPDALGKNKEAVKTLVADSTKKIDDIKKKTDELVTYIKAEDYKDDKGAKAQTYKAEIMKLIDDYYVTEDKLSAILQPIADGAEETILKDHPLKDYILGSKKVLTLSQNITTAVTDQYNEDVYDIPAIKKQYDVLEKEIKANTAKEFKVSDASLQSKKGYYESFNKEGDNFLATLRKVLREAETSKTITEGQASEIQNGYQNIVSRYNNFVD